MWSVHWKPRKVGVSTPDVVANWQRDRLLRRSFPPAFRKLEIVRTLGKPAAGLASANTTFDWRDAPEPELDGCLATLCTDQLAQRLRSHRQ